MSRKCVYIEEVAGCDQRRRDKAHLEEYLIKNNVDVVGSPELADFAVVISNDVFFKMQDESLKMFERIQRFIPHERIVDIGCLSSSCPHLTNELRIHVIPPKDHSDMDVRLRAIGVLDSVTVPYAQVRFKSIANPDDSETWFLSLGEGCEFGACGYCVKPKSTGRLIDADPDLVLNGYLEGLRRGYKRFRFVAEDVGAYGKTIGKTLPWLVKYLLDHTESKFAPVHFNSFMNGINPASLEEYEDQFFSLFQRKDVVFDGLQLTPQTFNKAMLALIGRRGNPDRWEAIIKSIKEISPKTEIWVQIIIGFPTQIESDLDKEMNVLAGLPVEIVHAYCYCHIEGNRLSRDFNNFKQEWADRLFAKFSKKAEKAGFNLEFKNQRSVFLSRPGMYPLIAENAYYHEYREMAR